MRLRNLSFVVALLLSLLSQVEMASAGIDISGESPLYTEYNTYIKAQNFLELVSVGSAQVNAKVSIYKIDGTFQKAVRVYIDPLTQTDLDINTLVGKTNTYGLIKIEFNNSNPNARLQGRMSVYRLNDNDSSSYSFAYALPLRQPLTGTTFETSNSFDPQGRGYVVPNWVSVTNLAATTEQFTHNLYDQAGNLVTSTTFTLPPNARRDLSGGHESGEAVFINEIVPTDSSAEYLSSLIRYSSNTLPGGTFRGYTFAMPVFARAGTAAEQFLPISNRVGDCYTQTNWVEVANVSSSVSTVLLSFRDKNGLLFSTTSVPLQPLSQYHFNAGSLLANRGSDLGLVAVSADIANSIVAESVVYYHDCSANSLQTGYNIQGDTAPEVPLVGSFNRFLGMENELTIVGTTGVSRSINLLLRSGGDDIHESTRTVSNFSSLLLNLNDEEFSTSTDTIGVISLDSSRNQSFLAYNLRVRKSGTDGKVVDFVIPTDLQ